MAKQKNIGVGVIGFGTIGTGVVRVLRDHAADIEARIGARLKLRRVADLDTKTDRGVRLPAGTLIDDAAALIDDPSVDVVVELIGGIEPARRFMQTAIRAGKSVVTANKALLSRHGLELAAMAEKEGVTLGFEASVGGGIPILRVIREALVGDRHLDVYGIVNGTANYILSQMAEGAGEFSEVLAKAQAMGLAEADPTFDIDGTDSLHKLVVLVAMAFGKKIDPARVHMEGISNISGADIEYAHEFGYTIKLLASARITDAGVEARVHPSMVPDTHLLSKVSGPFNAICLRSRALGTSIYYGQGAGMMPTATAVVADIADAARAMLSGSAAQPAYGRPATSIKSARVLPMKELSHEHYVRLSVADKPGVLAKIAEILGRQGIGIATVAQHERAKRGAVPVVIRTHKAKEGGLEKALARIRKLDSCRAAPNVIRVEEALGEAD